MRNQTDQEKTISYIEDQFSENRPKASFIPPSGQKNVPEPSTLSEKTPLLKRKSNGLFVK